MRSNLDLDARAAGAGSARVGVRRTVAELKPGQRPLKSAKASEQKLGATARSFAILEHVAQSRAPVDVLDIIASLKLPKATAYRLVDWFVCQGYLSREPGRRRLIVGPKLTNLAFGALSSSMRNDTPHVVLQRLVHHAQRDLQYRHFAQWRGGLSRPRRGRALAAAAALHHRARACRCIAARSASCIWRWPPAPRRRRLLQSLELRRFTDRTITDGARLDAELRQIRKEQVSFDREEYLVGVICMAVPVIGKNGELLAALAIQAPEARMNVQTARRHLPALRHAATELAEIFQDKT